MLCYLDALPSSSLMPHTAQLQAVAAQNSATSGLATVRLGSLKLE